jgi:hypothetical protein
MQPNGGRPWHGVCVREGSVTRLGEPPAGDHDDADDPAFAEQRAGQACCPAQPHVPQGPGGAARSRRARRAEFGRAPGLADTSSYGPLQAACAGPARPALPVSRIESALERKRTC